MQQTTLNKTFRSPINRETTLSVTRLADDVESELILTHDGTGKNAFINWRVEDLDLEENIGIFCYEKPFVVSDYDGVFEVPEQAIQLLKEAGFDTSYLDD